MPALGGGMSRFGIIGFDQLVRRDGDGDTLEAEPIDRAGALQWLGLCGLVAVAAILACVAFATWSFREGALLAVAAILALTFCLLLKRHQSFHRTLAAERRQLHTAVNNIPQGLVLYDASARIVICNQQYIEMFGLSPDIAKQGCTMQQLIEHRKETGSFDGDVEEFCAAIIRNVRLGKVTHQITEAPGGRSILIINQPLE